MVGQKVLVHLARRFETLLRNQYGLGEDPPDKRFNPAQIHRILQGICGEARSVRAYLGTCDACVLPLHHR